LSLSDDKELVVMEDAYYDNSLFALTRNDMWLRQRNGVFELKFPMVSSSLVESGLSGIDYYNESTDWHTICDHMNTTGCAEMNQGFKPNFSLIEAKAWLASHGITMFSRFCTRRSRQNITMSVKSGTVEVNIDLDEVDFLPPVDSEQPTKLSQKPYVLGEIELISSLCGQQEDSGIIMAEVFDELELSESRIRGKVLEYIYRYRPEHYETLTECGVIGSKGI
jgi:hypothetical protein